MTKPLDELYFEWLYSQISSVRRKNPTRTYWFLTRLLYNKEFVWIVSNDNNRVEDGRDLRYEFIDAKGLDDVDLEWIGLGCSILEMLIGLSRRLSFEAEGESRGWFWKLIENLGLKSYNDGVHTPQGRVDAILDRLIWRTYEPNGVGGLFPLNKSEQDQREVEIWYQMSTYILELDD